MSVYNRKGGSGKSGTLRQQFNYYKRQLTNRLIDEYAFQKARGVSPEGIPKTLFKNLDYNKILQEGITRKEKGVTKRFIGEEAIRIQINSLKLRASKSYQAELYINNYINSLSSIGLSNDKIDIIEEKLKKLSIDKLTYLINENILPQIYYIYSEQFEEKEIFEDIINSIEKGINTSDFKTLISRKKELKEIAKKEFKIFGKL